MKVVALVAIVPADLESELKKVAKEAGAMGATIFNARGSGAEDKRSFLSLTFDGNQTVLLYILEEGMSKNVLKALRTFMEAETDHGLAFTVPINHIIGLDKALLHKFEKNIQEEERF